jgi:hypothetical protein
MIQRFDPREGQEIFPFFKVTKPVLAPFQRSVQ